MYDLFLAQKSVTRPVEAKLAAFSVSVRFTFPHYDFLQDARSQPNFSVATSLRYSVLISPLGHDTISPFDLLSTAVIKTPRCLGYGFGRNISKFSALKLQSRPRQRWHLPLLRITNWKRKIEETLAVVPFSWPGNHKNISTMGSFEGAEEKQVEAKEEESLTSSSLVGGNGNEIESIVIVHNVAKRHNVGTLARSATAFGAAEMVLVGRRDFNCFGSHGAACHLRFRHFPSLTQACTYLKEHRGADICGVEIREDAVPLNSQQTPPFRRSTAFLLGNEGTGLSPRECAICDFFVYIPQYGPGTASLNVTVAASIVLHHFAVWACFPERPRSGGKFLVADRSAARRAPSPESVRALVEERRLKRENNTDLLVLEDPDSNYTNLLHSIFHE